VASVGHWRTDPCQPHIIGYERRATMSNGAVDKSTMPDGRRVSLRTYKLRAARKQELARLDAKRARSRRAKARKAGR